MVATDMKTRLEHAVFKVYEQALNDESPLTWREIDEHTLWCELVSCILGSQVSFEHAQAAASHLNSTRLLDITNTTQIPKDFEDNIAYALSLPIYPPFDYSGRGSKYRYYRMRANHIRRTAELIYGRGNSLHNILVTLKDPVKTRFKIIATTIGIGPKQASLFLRNIYYTDNLAILDSHVLRYMILHDFIPKIPQAISKLTTYELIESILQRYAKDIQVKLSYLDRAIWVVMRVFQQEFAQ